MPQISVIVPVYKVEPYLRRCVDSIIAQTFLDFELILVDDGSPDQCPAICDEYATRDSRIKVIHQSNGGLSAARNAGLDWIITHSDSQWVFFVDSDDWIHPITLECLLNANHKYNTNVCICGYEETKGEDPNINMSDLIPCLRETESFFVGQRINVTIACGKLCRKKCFQTIRYPVGKIHEDEYTTYKILFQYPSVAFVPAPLYAYFSNQEGITKARWSPKRLDAIDAIKQQCVFLKENGFKKAYKTSCMAYLFCLANQLELMGKEYPEIKKIIQKQLRREFWKYRKDAGITLAKDPWICQSAFPLFVTPYLQMKKLLRIITPERVLAVWNKKKQ